MYYWCSHCASKSYIYQNTEFENLNLSFERFVMLVYSFSGRKTTYSCNFAEPTKEAWKPKFWPADFTFPSMAASIYICPNLVVASM